MLIPTEQAKEVAWHPSAAGGRCSEDGKAQRSAGVARMLPHRRAPQELAC